jgi:hypothetical protein
MTATFAAASLLNGCTADHGATLDQFEAALSARPSATAVLTDWCKARAIATDPAIIARRSSTPAAEEPEDLRRQLAVSADAALGYRHVELVCGDKVLSVAHNWYVPARLSDEMNRVLETSETPFGKIVGPLHFTRELRSSIRGAGPGCPEGTVLTQRAMLRLPDGAPLSYLIECYSAINLAGSS